MPELNALGKFLILGGAVLVVLGALVLLVARFSGENGDGGLFSWVGRLPGDLYIKRETYTIYAPLTTGLIVSGIVSLAYYLFSLFWNR